MLVLNCKKLLSVLPAGPGGPGGPAGPVGPVGPETIKIIKINGPRLVPRINYISCLQFKDIFTLGSWHEKYDLNCTVLRSGTVEHLRSRRQDTFKNVIYIH